MGCFLETGHETSDRLFTDGGVGCGFCRSLREGLVASSSATLLSMLVRSDPSWLPRSASLSAEISRLRSFPLSKDIDDTATFMDQLVIAQVK